MSEDSVEDLNIIKLLEQIQKLDDLPLNKRQSTKLRRIFYQDI